MSESSATTVLTATIPAGLRDREALFDALASQLHFPDYFGRNWDALYDCLTDFGWLPEGVSSIVIEHLGPPPLTPDQAEVYAAVLADAVAEHAGYDGPDRLTLEVRWS